MVWAKRLSVLSVYVLPMSAWVSSRYYASSHSLKNRHIKVNLRLLITPKCECVSCDELVSNSGCIQVLLALQREF